MPSLPQADSGLQEILFHELHHRFYNSLQLLSSTLGGLARDHRRPDEVRQLQDRIVMLGGLHRTLSKPLGDMTDMGATLGDLCSSLTTGYGRGEVALDVCGTAFPDDPMIVRGLTLILVELVTNALKHGVPGEGQIAVTVVCMADSCRLTVANDAASACLDRRREPLVASRFAKAMGGKLIIVPGTRHEVRVTVPFVADRGEYRDIE